MTHPSYQKDGLFKTGRLSPIYISENRLNDHLLRKIGRDEEDLNSRKNPSLISHTKRTDYTNVNVLHLYIQATTD